MFLYIISYNFEVVCCTEQICMWCVHVCLYVHICAIVELCQSFVTRRFFLLQQITLAELNLQSNYYFHAFIIG